ncbi:MAG: hypothetical protein QE271_03580 [Bacteriovoracaceae bacterium]|nr:hypothetical protein [Bacteriovoracaceae bacterium]
MQSSSSISPLTGILAEEAVVIDFGEYEGKSVMDIAETEPEFYQFLLKQKEVGNFAIRRTKDKIFKLYLAVTVEKRTNPNANSNSNSNNSNNNNTNQNGNTGSGSLEDLSNSQLS